MYFNHTELIKTYLARFARTLYCIRIHPDIYPYISHPDPLSQTPLDWVSLTLILIEIKRKIHHQSNFSKGPNAVIGQLTPLVEQGYYRCELHTLFFVFFYSNETFCILIVNHIVSVSKPKNPLGFDALLEARINHVGFGTNHVAGNRNAITILLNDPKIQFLFHIFMLAGLLGFDLVNGHHCIRIFQNLFGILHNLEETSFADFVALTGLNWIEIRKHGFLQKFNFLLQCQPRAWIKWIAKLIIWKTQFRLVYFLCFRFM